MTKATVFTDASFCSRNKIGGWAAWVRIDGHKKGFKGYGSLKGPVPTSADAEVMAALNGIWIAATNGAKDILVRSDCKTVEQALEKRVRNQRIKNLWNRAMAMDWAKGITLESRHVKAHVAPNGQRATWVNNWCDEHAKIGMAAARRGRPLTAQL